MRHHESVAAGVARDATFESTATLNVSARQSIGLCLQAAMFNNLRGAGGDY